MAGESAIRKVVIALESVLAALPPSAFIDRPDDAPFNEGELPANNIITGGEVSFGLFDQGTTIHRAKFDIDMIVESSDASTINAAIAEMEADIVAALAVDRTLGGLAQDIIVEASQVNTGIYADAGARTLSVEIHFLTPLGDHRTIIGATGLIP